MVPISPVLVAAALLNIYAAPHLGSDDPNIFRLKVRFLRKGSLTTAIDPEWMGVPTSYILVYENCKKRKRIKNLIDLKGFVRVDTSVAALNYVRLSTSPLLPRISNELLYEVIARSKVDSEFLFGSPFAKTAPEFFDNGAYGIVPIKGSQRANVPEPVVRWTGHNWEIRQLGILFESMSHYRFVNILESVGKDGRYSQRLLKVSPGSDLKSIRFWLPMYE